MGVWVSRKGHSTCRKVYFTEFDSTFLTLVFILVKILITGYALKVEENNFSSSERWLPMAYETGLYGQNERGNHFDKIADANRLADIDSEGTYVGIKTEAQYRDLMASAWMQELMAEQNIENLEKWEATEDKNEREGIIADILSRALTEAREQFPEQRDSSWQKIADLYDEMMDNGFHITVRYRCLSCSLPQAFHTLWQARKRMHENAPTPQSRIKAPPRMYNGNIDKISMEKGKDIVKSAGGIPANWRSIKKSK